MSMIHLTMNDVKYSILSLNKSIYFPHTAIVLHFWHLLNVINQELLRLEISRVLVQKWLSHKSLVWRKLDLCSLTSFKNIIGLSRLYTILGNVFFSHYGDVKNSVLKILVLTGFEQSPEILSGLWSTNIVNYCCYLCSFFSCVWWYFCLFNRAFVNTGIDWGCK